jgi:hypothetical protein
MLLRFLKPHAHAGAPVQVGEVVDSDHLGLTDHQVRLLKLWGTAEEVEKPKRGRKRVEKAG